MRLSLLPFVTAALGYVVNEGTNCTLYPESLKHGGEEVDDSPSIHEAFDKCGINGTVIFAKDHIFHVNSVLNTTNLVNCDVSLQGELRFSTDVPYWLSHSYPVILQKHTTAWLFGGENVTFRGEEGGWYNGQGQYWYTQNRNNSNQLGRPISFTVFNATNVLIDGLKIVQPQFWATHVWQSKNVSITNFYSNATSNDEWNTVNTDGFDSWNSDNLRIENATIVTYDDCVAPKGNTTNLHVKNVTCYGSNGMCIGSVGQYPQWPDYVANVTFEDVKLVDGKNGGYIKTYQGTAGPPDDDGIPTGGGSGSVNNITFRNFEMENNELPILVTQCIYTENDGEYCDTSKVAVSDVTWNNFTGTSTYNVVASLFCSPKNPCPGMKMEGIGIQSVNKTLGLPLWNTTLQDEVYQCANLVDADVPCNHKAPNDYGQHPSENIQ